MLLLTYGYLKIFVLDLIKYHAKNNFKGKK